MVRNCGRHMARGSVIEAGISFIKVLCAELELNLSPARRTGERCEGHVRETGRLAHLGDNVLGRWLRCCERQHDSKIYTCRPIGVGIAYIVAVTRLGPAVQLRPGTNFARDLPTPQQEAETCATLAREINSSHACSPRRQPCAFLPAQTIRALLQHEFGSTEVISMEVMPTNPLHDRHSNSSRFSLCAVELDEGELGLAEMPATEFQSPLTTGRAHTRFSQRIRSSPLHTDFFSLCGDRTSSIMRVAATKSRRVLFRVLDSFQPHSLAPAQPHHIPFCLWICKIHVRGPTPIAFHSPPAVSLVMCALSSFSCSLRLAPPCSTSDARHTCTLAAGSTAKEMDPSHRGFMVLPERHRYC